jgi:hypothetical protein
VSLAAHDPSCAITRLGDIRAWCDCGIGETCTERAASFARGRKHERKRIIERLRFNAVEFKSMSDRDADLWCVLAEIMTEEADIIESGDYYV